MLITSFSETRSTLVNELEDERAGLNEIIRVTREEYINDGLENLTKIQDEARDAIRSSSSISDLINKQLKRLQLFLLQVG